MSFRRRYYNNAYIGAVFLVLAMIVPFAKGTDSDKSIITVGMVLVGTLMIAQNLIQRLKFTDDSVIISGLLTKKLSYVDMARVEVGSVAIKTGSGAGHVSTINLVSKQDKKLSLVPYNFTGFEGDQGWASLLLKKVSENSIEMDPKAEQYLSNAAKARNYAVQFLAK